MSIRFLRSLELALLMACITVVTVSAKGGYSFITITGADLKETIRTSDLALTEDFFAFADFSRDRIKAPADAGAGYEITRYYLDGGREIAFDRLHYYPATGYVYYDGLINGSSEYDGEWYTARPEMKSMFESLLAGEPITRPQSIYSENDPTTDPAINAGKTDVTLDPGRSFLPIAIAAGFALTILLLFSRRKAASQ